jgi:hypothetical protein
VIDVGVLKIVFSSKFSGEELYHYARYYGIDAVKAVEQLFNTLKSKSATMIGVKDPCRVVCTSERCFNHGPCRYVYLNGTLWELHNDDKFELNITVYTDSGTSFKDTFDTILNILKEAKLDNIGFEAGVEML